MGGSQSTLGQGQNQTPTCKVQFSGLPGFIIQLHVFMVCVFNPVTEPWVVFDQHCLVWSEFHDPAALHFTDLIIIKLRLNCDNANLHTVASPSTRCAESIMHCVAKSGALHRKWMGFVDLTSVAGLSLSAPQCVDTTCAAPVCWSDVSMRLPSYCWYFFDLNS